MYLLKETWYPCILLHAWSTAVATTSSLHATTSDNRAMLYLVIATANEISLAAGNFAGRLYMCGGHRILYLWWCCKMFLTV